MAPICMFIPQICRYEQLLLCVFLILLFENYLWCFFLGQYIVSWLIYIFFQLDTVFNWWIQPIHLYGSLWNVYINFCFLFFFFLIPWFEVYILSVCLPSGSIQLIFLLFYSFPFYLMFYSNWRTLPCS